MSTTKPQQDDTENNVHVMIRIRPNSDQEKKNRYPNLISQVSYVIQVYTEYFSYSFIIFLKFNISIILIKSYK